MWEIGYPHNLLLAGAQLAGPNTTGTHTVLNWHLILLKDGELLMYGGDLGLHVEQVVLQGIHELQTDPQFLQRLGRAADPEGRQREHW